MVMVNGYANQLVIVPDGQIVPSHERSFRKQTIILDSIHYLAMLGTKPRALDRSLVFCHWKLHGCFAAFRAVLEQHDGAMSGSRRFAQVL